MKSLSFIHFKKILQSYNQILNLLLITEKDKSHYVFIKNFNRLMFSKTIYQQHYPNSIGEKLVFIDDRFTLPYIIFKGKDCINEFIRWVLDKQKWTQQITKKYFNKRLIMTNED